MSELSFGACKACVSTSEEIPKLIIPEDELRTWADVFFPWFGVDYGLCCVKVVLENKGFKCFGF